MPRKARMHLPGVPAHVAIYMDVMYAGFAGAKTGLVRHPSGGSP